jgi:hypothetical protein
MEVINEAIDVFETKEDEVGGSDLSPISVQCCKDGLNCQ